MKFKTFTVLALLVMLLELAAYGGEVETFMACAENLSAVADLSAYNTVANAADVNDLRIALGYDVDRLNESPASVEIIHPFTRKRYNKLLDGDGLIELVFRSLYATPMRPLLPQIIYDASEGIFDAILLIARDDLLRQEIRSWRMYFSVLCNEEIPFSSPEAFEAVLAQYPEFASFFGGFEVGGLSYAVCPGWGAGQADAIENEPVSSDIPTLILAGEYDPTTAPDDACIAEMGTATQPFVVPAEVAETIELEPFTSEELGVSGVAPAGWTKVGPGTFVRGSSAVDPTAIVHDAVPMSAEALLGVITGQFGLDEAPESVGEREAYIVEKIEQLEVPGAAVAIVQGGELVYANGFGVRDLETNEPVTPETLMMIGSNRSRTASIRTRSRLIWVHTPTTYSATSHLNGRMVCWC